MLLQNLSRHVLIGSEHFYQSAKSSLSFTQSLGSGSRGKLSTKDDKQTSFALQNQIWSVKKRRDLKKNYLWMVHQVLA